MLISHVISFDTTMFGSSFPMSLSISKATFQSLEPGPEIYAVKQALHRGLPFSLAKLVKICCA
jgi:hypothetical protein